MLQGTGDRFRTLMGRALSIAVLVSMVLPASIVLMPTASSDPVDVNNPDDTNTVTWDFDEPSDYIISNLTLSGGAASLPYYNQSASDDSASDFQQAATLTNADTTSLPGSVTIDETTTGSYQVTLQPGPEGVDAYISEDKETDKLGDDPDLKLDSETSKQFRILMWFDLSSIPSDAVIDDATLRLYEYVTGKGNEVVFGVHSLNRTFAESDVTWNRYDVTNSWTVPGGDYNLSAYSWGSVDNWVGWQSVDVSKIVEKWVRGDLSNNGMILVPVAGGGDAAKTFYSSDETDNADRHPQLVVNYTLQGGIAVLESRALGPGTNATFTLASWANGTRSLVTDDFGGSSLDPKWSWMNDPVPDGGSYDIGWTTPGWLHVVGAPGTENIDTDVGANFLYQEVTGDFTAETFLSDSFTVNSMGAGLFMYESPYEWLSIAKTDPGSSGKLQVTVCEGGTSTMMVNTDWSTSTDARLVMVREGAAVSLYASQDFTSLDFIYRHEAVLGYEQRISLGLFVYSSSTTAPVVDFSYFDVDPLTVLPSVMVSARTGNSTSFADASWGAWSPVMPGQEAVIGDTGRYMQYRVHLETAYDWFASTFDSFECYYELYGTHGTIETYDFEPTDFSMWLTLTTYQGSAGRTSYHYSTDRGVTWTYAGTGGSYSISSTEPSIRVRVVFDNLDTLETPSVESIDIVYANSLTSFFVVTPAEAVAGEAFSVSVYAKDSTNATMIHFTGPVTLTATGPDGITDASGDLAVGMAQVTTGGYVTVPNEKYYVAESIRIRASSLEVSGLGQTMTILPGPVARIVVSPDVHTIEQLTSQEYTATAYDDYGNLVPDAEFSWAVGGGIGTVAPETGPTVEFTAGIARATGWLNVSSGSAATSVEITVTAPANAPQFDYPVPDQLKDEDFGSWTVDLAPLVSDDEHPDSELRWFATNETIVSASGENRTGQLVLTLTTKLDMFGTNVIRLFVVDPDGVSGETNVTVVLAPVNDRPTIDPIDPLVVRYDDPYTYNFRYYVEDVDNGYDELSLSVDDESLPYAAADMLAITFTYPIEFNGTTQRVTVTVDDGDLSSSTIVSITVSSDYVPEVFDPLPDVVMYQGETRLGVFDLDEHFTDPDADMLYYVSGFEHVGVEINSNNSVDLQAPTDWSGVEYIVFSGVDPTGARIEDAIAVTVLPVNQPPWISGVPDLQVRFDFRYEFDLTRYVGDPDDDIDSLTITTDDLHVAVLGTVLALQYPAWMNGTSHPVEITVSDGELSDSWTMIVTVTDDYPPEALELEDHSFKEDLPMPYPLSGGLEDLFIDLEGLPLTFGAFSWSEHVNVTVVNQSGEWRVDFAASANWYGETKLTIRATDLDGGMVEAVIGVTVVSAADVPVMDIPRGFEVTEGVQSAFDISSYIGDPDSSLADMRFEVGFDQAAYVDAMAGMLIIEFPEGFLDQDEYSRNVTVELTVIDQDGLMDGCVVTITVTKPHVAAPTGQSPWLWLAMIAMGGTASGLFALTLRMRKKPFVVTDVMLVHNDGFLIGRHAAPTKGEIDQDVLSGMLTAVLNFVEDSMAASEDALRSFGFDQYKVLVRRGERAFMAVVHEGDAPEGTDKDMGAFLEKVEKIYRKSLAKWSGDIESEFAGVDLLLGAWVKEHSKGRNGKSRSVFGLRGARTTK